MRCVPTLVAAVALTLTAPAGASPRLLPQPSPEPLGKFVRDARTIHVLKVKSVDAKGATFETAAALKGKPADAPFGLLEFHGEKEREAARSLFEAGTTALCFVHGEINAKRSDPNDVQFFLKIPPILQWVGTQQPVDGRLRPGHSVAVRCS